MLRAICIFYWLLLQVTGPCTSSQLTNALLSESMKSNRIYVSSIDRTVQHCDFKLWVKLYRNCDLNNRWLVFTLWCCTSAVYVVVMCLFVCPPSVVSRCSTETTEYTLCLKKTTLMLHTNFNAHQPILVIFGRDIAEWVCRRMVICCPTYPSLCLCTTWGKCTPEIASFLPYILELYRIGGLYYSAEYE